MVEEKGIDRSVDVSGGKRFFVGANVTMMIVLAFGVVVISQIIAFSYPLRGDMTSTGVNSLSESTEKLLRGLDNNVRLTSLYFETDREEADQPRYREAMRNLLDLYESTNRSRITAEWINPLKDHEKLQKLMARLRDKPAYKEGIAAYQARLDAFRNEIDGKIDALLQEEIQRTAPPGGTVDRSAPPTALAQVSELLRRLAAELELSREQIDALANAANPQLAAAVDELRSLYPKITRALKEIPKFAAAELARNPNMPASEAEVLRESGERYTELVATLEGETTKLGELDPLKVEDVLSRLQPTSNPVVVETDDEAIVLDFSSVWPPQEGLMGRATFAQRNFKGEEQLTAAIVRATFKEQTAVIFVRYGGGPLFMGGFMPGQPPAPYAAMKQQLEDVNFVVAEWDLKTKDTPPEIEPPAARTIFVVLKPEAPPQDPMGRPPQEPPFGDSHRQALLKAMGDQGRALFIAGWAPSPFGPIPSPYEYSDYLKTTWGITIDTSYLLIETVNVKPGEYQVARQNFHYMAEDNLEVTGHPIVKGGQARLLGLPSTAPLALASPLPDGVHIEPLVSAPRQDGLWGVKNLQTYQEQQQTRGFLSRAEGDREGPFTLAVAGTKVDAKIVVVSSRGFAEDAVAFNREPFITAQGIGIRATNPGNITLFVNSLHWLSDNEQLLDVGKPLDSAVLTIKNPSTVKAVQALTMFVWPAIALAVGGAVWWVRRR